MLISSENHFFFMLANIINNFISFSLPDAFVALHEMYAFLCVL